MTVNATGRCTRRSWWTSEADRREAAIGVGQAGADRWGRAGRAAGSWTLVESDLMVAAGDCSSPFPNGEARLVENRDGPRVAPTSSCTSRSCGFVAGRVRGDLPRPRRQPWRLDVAVGPDRSVGRGGRQSAAGRSRRAHPRRALAAGLGVRPRPSREPPVDWLCSDIICYPQRLLGLVQRWFDAGAVRNIICTIKFQGVTDQGVVRRVPGHPWWACTPPAPQPPQANIHPRPGNVDATRQRRSPLGPIAEARASTTDTSVARGHRRVSEPRRDSDPTCDHRVSQWFPRYQDTTRAGAASPSTKHHTRGPPTWVVLGDRVGRLR